MRLEIELRSVARDRRGAILVVAMPMALILVGCIWQLAGMTEAASFRESLQDAADATAFQSAVLHARGMNAVAALNIVMMLLIAVVASLRSLDSLAAAALTLVGAGDPQLAAASRPDPALTARVEAALSIVSQVQAGIAASAPLMAAVESALDSGAFYRAQPAGSDSLAVSGALLPGSADRELATDPQRAWLFTSDPAAGARRRIGAELGTGAASLPIERPCADAEPCSEPLAQQLAAAHLPLPARVWSRAENGNVMLQTWSIASSGQPGHVNPSERALGLLGRGPGVLRVDRNALAQAEYYFDCPAARPAWDGCAEHALWSLGWRARLRRLWRPDGADAGRALHIARALEPCLASIDRELRARADRTPSARDLVRTFFAEPQLAQRPPTE
jgi:hypothetical protein